MIKVNKLQGCLIESNKVWCEAKQFSYKLSYFYHFILNWGSNSNVYKFRFTIDTNEINKMYVPITTFIPFDIHFCMQVNQSKLMWQSSQ